MEKTSLRFEGFLNDITPVCREFVERMNDVFLQNGYKLKMDLAKSGYVISYTHAKTKRVIANYVFRKNNLVIRIYGEFINKYIEFIRSLPDGMLNSIEKSPVCKRLIDPEKCNARCPKGYDFTIKDTRYQKCRYNCFMFEVNTENIPSIETFLGNEIKERAV